LLRRTDEHNIAFAGLEDNRDGKAGVVFKMIEAPKCFSQSYTRTHCLEGFDRANQRVVIDQENGVSRRHSRFGGYVISKVSCIEYPHHDIVIRGGHQQPNLCLFLSSITDDRLGIAINQSHNVKPEREFKFVLL